ncbi:uncharacterized protein B0H18DRAFT_992376, partial [Fomitopsis serialis]|uniref:uncharacterized protein n=1 Tax=Fomitopsis serialis TaxID=139415 RepID=UPI002008E9F0
MRPNRLRPARFDPDWPSRFVPRPLHCNPPSAHRPRSAHVHSISTLPHVRLLPTDRCHCGGVNVRNPWN